jgi:glyoxylase-like metal-dependent hydrolase (beta-lactamase superfamily II)
MKIGKYNLRIINSGFFGLDGGAMFGIIPKVLWQKTNPPDDANRIKLATRHLLLESTNKKIIIDVGMGTKWNEKLKKIYAVDENLSMVKALNDVGLKYEDITDVILTHLHFDHAGASTTSLDGKFIPTFPNAKYHVQKEQFEWAKNPTEKDRGSFIKDDFVPLAKEGVLNFINGYEQFDDEVEFIVTNGHTFGQQLVKISDSSNTILQCADLVPTISHIPVPYLMGYDVQPLITVREKNEILPVAVEENWKLFFGHDPEIAFATVKQTDKGVRAAERFTNFG